MLICGSHPPWTGEYLESQMPNRKINFAPRNLLLDAFENESSERVDPYLERIEFELGDVICEAGGVLHHAYFFPMAPSFPC